jgi:hypothetical protein
MPSSRADTGWPDLPYESWKDAKTTLHMFTQMIGKLRLARSPAEPEWQHVPLYVTAWGLSSGPMPDGDRSFEASFDLVHHRLDLTTSEGDGASLGLVGRSVAQFYADVLATLAQMGVTITIDPKPQEVPDPIPFPDDRRAAYDPVWVPRFHRAMTSVDQVFERFRAPFKGRHTRVQFFWGTFDLAYFRFSGRPASPVPGAGVISRPAMDAEQFCWGFWPGDERVAEPAFFSYTFPPPPGIEGADATPGAWNPDLGEFILLYETVRQAPAPDEVLTQFLERTYEAAVRSSGWDERNLTTDGA